MLILHRIAQLLLMCIEGIVGRGTFLVEVVEEVVYPVVVVAW
jgi:hypothetical protein